MWRLERDGEDRPILAKIKGQPAARVVVFGNITDTKPFSLLAERLSPDEWEELQRAAQNSPTDPPAPVRGIAPPVGRAATPQTPLTSSPTATETPSEKPVDADLEAYFEAAAAQQVEACRQERIRAAAETRAAAQQAAAQQVAQRAWETTARGRQPGAFANTIVTAIPDLFATAPMTWRLHQVYQSNYKLGRDNFLFDCPTMAASEREDWQNRLMDAGHDLASRATGSHLLAGSVVVASMDDATATAHNSCQMAIFAGVLNEQFPLPPNLLFAGALNGHGEFLPLRHPFSVAAAAKQHGGWLFVPAASAELCRAVYGKVVGVADVTALYQEATHFNPFAREWPTAALPRTQEVSKCLDLSNVAGQEGPKRALEIAVAGGHDLLLVGPPGEGKSLLASTIPTFAPRLTAAQRFEVAAIYQAQGLLDGDAVAAVPPLRVVDRNISMQALLGGGSAELQPGEVTLAHYGFLYFDEFLQAKPSTLEALRSPLQDGYVTVSRTGFKTRLPAAFQLIAASNPCPCGCWSPGDTSGCRCKQDRNGRSTERHNYTAKLSQAMLDRLEIRVWTGQMRTTLAKARVTGGAESSAVVRERVMLARSAQRSRYLGTGVSLNARVGADWEGLMRYETEVERRLEYLAGQTPMSTRGRANLLRVAQTICDLECGAVITAAHLEEAEGLMTTPLPTE